MNELCALYLEGQRLRDEAKKLSQKRLAKRFALDPSTVSKTAHCQPCRARATVQQHIRKLISQRDRLKSQAALLTLPRLCKRYGFDYRTVVAELERLDAWRAVA